MSTFNLSVVFVFLGLFSSPTVGSPDTMSSGSNQKSAGISLEYLYQHWVHSFEEQGQTDKNEVYRPANFKQFRPTRFRMQYIFHKSGDCDWLWLAPNDAHGFRPGKWRVDPNDKSALQIITAQETISYRITELERDILRLARIGRAPTLGEPQGISSGSTAHRGMTWIHTSSNVQTGTVTVGCSGCDAYRGDTPCAEQLPVLCIFKPTPAFQAPVGLDNSNLRSRWSGGIIATTIPHAGFTALADANDYCRAQFGPNWRVAEFHDGWGWNFQAYGGTVGAPTRFWVYINDQPANCWNAPPREVRF